MITILNYGLGNLSSILNMCRHLGLEAQISADEADICKADKLILPGVGHFKRGMDNLRESGLQALLNEEVLIKKKPVLGICLGAQLMTMHSEEGDSQGLEWVPAHTIRFDATQLGKLRIPHMGWAEVLLQDKNLLWEDLPAEPRFYHVHSYHFQFTDPSMISATAHYGYEFACAFQKDNIYGVQFHPEKSHKYGMKILQNFANL